MSNMEVLKKTETRKTFMIQSVEISGIHYDEGWLEEINAHI